MGRFLAIETATDVCSVAVLSEDRVLIEKTLIKPRSHSENLAPMIKGVLSYAGIEIKAITGIVVSKGPGSYTGLRIGVSAAKGLAFSHNLDLIGVSSLLVLATEALPFAEAGDTILCAFNSRRHEVYISAYQVDESCALVPIGNVVSKHKDDLAGHILALKPEQKCLIVGEGGRLVAESLESSIAQLTVIPPHIVRPSASTLATLGAIRHKKGRLDDLSSFEPFYLNEFVPKKQKKSIFDRLPF